MLQRMRNDIGGLRLRLTHPTIPRSWLRPLQRRRQILDQIIGMLESRGEADKTLADAERGAIFRLQALLRRGGRVCHEALGVAEIVGNLGKLELVEHAERALL